MNNKHISFDYWNTMVRSNPEFRVELNKFIKLIYPSICLDTWEESRKLIKNKYNDLVTNKYEVIEYDSPEVPNIKFLYKELLSMCGISVNRYNLDYIISKINRLFLKYPPIFMDGCIQVIDSLISNKVKVYVCSNTMFIGGETIQKLIDRTFGDDVIEGIYSDVTGYSKPHREMFKELNLRGVELHVGDSPGTDGKCVSAGIEFYHMDKKNNYLTLIYRLNNENTNALTA